MLILYGVLFLVVENRRRTPTVTDLSQLSYKQALVIGFWQVLAMIPGTSRSGATIVGGLLLGASRPVVTEFTFFLAIPVMFGASLLKAAKYLAAGLTFTGGEVTALAVACVTAFLVSVAAIKFLVGFVKSTTLNRSAGTALCWEQWFWQRRCWAFDQKAVGIAARMVPAPSPGMKGE